MASVAGKLSFAEFQAKYGQSDRSYEFWDGEAIARARASSIHGLLQAILGQLLREAGYKSALEVELRIDPRYYPKPDVIDTSGKIETAYPTKAVDVAIEILSPEDPMSHTMEKCRLYAEWGFPYVYIVDPDRRIVYRYSADRLEATDLLISIRANQIWEALDRDIA